MMMAAVRRIAVDVLALALGGLLYTLAFPPHNWTGVGWIALAPLFLVLRGKTFLGAALCRILYGIAICSGVAGWLYQAISSFFVAQASEDLLLTAVSFVLFVGVYTGLAAGAAALIMRGSRALCWIAIPALWVVAEFARSRLFSGFSWGLLGYSQSGHPLMIQIADLTGVYGISFLLAATSYAAAELARALYRSAVSAEPASVPWCELAGTGVVLAIVLAYGAVRLRQYRAGTGASVNVALVRHDMPAAERWQRAYYTGAFFRYVELTRDRVAPNSADLVVWPEFASGFYLDRDPAMHLVGGPRLGAVDGVEHAYNSAYLFSPNGKLLDTYDKVRLLPFAEFHPSFLPGLGRHESDYTSQFTPGSRATVFSIRGGWRFGVMICFEATYPGLARDLTRRGAEFLVNISNDVWLAGAGGRTAAAQHFAMAVIRAVENRRPLARATMAGIDGFIDPAGRAYDLSEAPDGVTIGRVKPREELSLYTRYGDWFVVLCAAFSIMCLVSARRHSRLK
jgi:apolipoprotein N-acyltransferase